MIPRQSHGLSFAKQSRLLKPAQYRDVFNGGRRAADRLASLFVRRNGAESPRLGMAVSKRVCNRAVGRNRIKRILRESFRHLKDDIGGVDLVVVAKPASAAASNAELRQSFDQLLAKASKSQSGK